MLVPPTFAQARPVLHVPATVAEPQQGWPNAPQAMHDAAPGPGSMQRNPALQVVLAQQAWPEPPQALHVMPPSTPAPHTPPGWHRLPSQQAAPTAPQAMQTSGPVAGFAQPRPVLQVWFAQHCCPLAPQGSQLLPPSTPWQDSPELQVFVPPQQAWPEPPQGMHVAGGAPGGLMHPSPELQVLFAQQACPLAPHGWQLLPPSTAWQESPARHWFAGVPLPMQQADPVAPQASHIPPVQ